MTALRATGKGVFGTTVEIATLSTDRIGQYSRGDEADIKIGSSSALLLRPPCPAKEEGDVVAVKTGACLKLDRRGRQSTVAGCSPCRAALAWWAIAGTGARLVGGV